MNEAKEEFCTLQVLFPDVNTALKVRQVFPTNGAVAERGFLLN